LLRGSSGKQARLRPASPPPGRHHLRPADSAKRDEAGFLLWDTAAFLRAGVGRTSCPPLPRRTPPRAVLARRHVLAPCATDGDPAVSIPGSWNRARTRHLVTSMVTF
jgi:hypothetical protein